MTNQDQIRYAAKHTHGHDSTMALFNLGKKDRHGRQKRIEHRGRLLRASRTGGVALRAQTRAAGINLTGNTSRGIRLSATPAKDTQIALQNGRFILRGRYGRGPTRLNVSKSGMTVSTRNRIGTINWVKPKRSSAKIGGVQLRGSNAVVLQALYALAATVGLLLQATMALLALAVQILIAALHLIRQLFSATPLVIRAFNRRLHNRKIRRELQQHNSKLLTALTSADNAVLNAASALIIIHWGQGASVQSRPTLAIPAMDEHSVHQARILLAAIERSKPNSHRWHLVYLAALGQTLSQRLGDDERGKLLLDIDEQIVQQAPRTVLQEQMLTVFADFAELRMELTADAASTAEPEATNAPPENHTQTVDLNTASLEALQRLPHIGPERAEALIKLRPIHKLEQLCTIDGIGPARLAEIKAFGVRL